MVIDFIVIIFVYDRPVNRTAFTIIFRIPPYSENGALPLPERQISLQLQFLTKTLRILLEAFIRPMQPNYERLQILKIEVQFS